MADVMSEPVLMIRSCYCVASAARHRSIALVNDMSDSLSNLSWSRASGQLSTTFSRMRMSVSSAS